MRRHRRDGGLTVRARNCGNGAETLGYQRKQLVPLDDALAHCERERDLFVRERDGGRPDDETRPCNGVPPRAEIYLRPERGKPPSLPSAAERTLSLPLTSAPANRQYSASAHMLAPPTPTKCTLSRSSSIP